MKPGSSISKENLSVEIRSNSSVSSLVFVEARVKQVGQWNIVDSIQMAFDPSNEIAQMAKIIDENIELVSGE